MDKKGIAVAGNILLDVVKNINMYPEPGMLAYISDVSYAVGGCVPNTAINLAKIDKTIPVQVFGKVGTDEYGKYLISELKKVGISTDGVLVSPDTPTSFTDVMSITTGERTLFCNMGANKEFGPDDIQFHKLNCDIFHIGYILLLDMFDAEDEEYGTVMASFLSKIKELGIKTSIDVVSGNVENYGEKIKPALKHCSYAIINEIECCKIFGIDAYDKENNLCIDNIKTAMHNMAKCGVSDKIIIHSKKISFILDVKSGNFFELPSLKIPKEKIKGSVGAGDAFCAGCLYGLYNNFDDKQILEFASSAAAYSLFAANSTDGMQDKEAIWKLNDEYERM